MRPWNRKFGKTGYQKNSSETTLGGGAIAFTAPHGSATDLRWGIFVPNLGTLGLWVLKLFTMYATDGRTSDILLNK